MTEQADATVYKVYGSDGEIIYVGCSLHARYRIVQHAHKAWWLEVANIEIEHFSDHFTALKREKELILTLKPRHNIIQPILPAPFPREEILAIIEANPVARTKKRRYWSAGIARAERRYGMPVERLLASLYQHFGNVKDVAKALGMSQSGIDSWLGLCDVIEDQCKPRRRRAAQ